MRISSAIARCAQNGRSAGLAIGLAGGLCIALVLGLNGRGVVSMPAFAFDGSTSPSTAALTPGESLRANAHVPDGKTTALTALQYAADQGQPVAQWKLGRMYADGDGVPRDDLRAFNYFSQIANSHPDEVPGSPQARFVANAFIALGHYYQTGIPNSKITADPVRARHARLCRDLFRRRRCAIRARPALSQRQAERSAPGGAVVSARRDQGPVPRRGRARRHAVPRPDGAAPGGRRPDVADALQGLRRQRRSLDQAAL